MKESSDELSPNCGVFWTARSLLLCVKTQLLPWTICKTITVNLTNNFHTVKWQECFKHSWFCCLFYPITWACQEESCYSQYNWALETLLQVCYKMSGTPRRLVKIWKNRAEELFKSPLLKKNNLCFSQFALCFGFSWLIFQGLKIISLVLCCPVASNGIVK